MGTKFEINTTGKIVKYKSMDGEPAGTGTPSEVNKQYLYARATQAQTLVQYQPIVFHQVSLSSGSCIKAKGNTQFWLKGGHTYKIEATDSYSTGANCSRGYLFNTVTNEKIVWYGDHGVGQWIGTAPASAIISLEMDSLISLRPYEGLQIGNDTYNTYPFISIEMLDKDFMFAKANLVQGISANNPVSFHKIQASSGTSIQHPNNTDFSLTANKTYEILSATCWTDSASQTGRWYLYDVTNSVMLNTMRQSHLTTGSSDIIKTIIKPTTNITIQIRTGVDETLGAIDSTVELVPFILICERDETDYLMAEANADQSVAAGGAINYHIVSASAGTKISKLSNTQFSLTGGETYEISTSIPWMNTTNDFYIYNVTDSQTIEMRMGTGRGGNVNRLGFLTVLFKPVNNTVIEVRLTSASTQVGYTNPNIYPYIIIKALKNLTITEEIKSYISQGDSKVEVADETGGNIYLQTDGSERMRVTSSGNIAIGTASPASSALLDLTSVTKGLLLPRLTTAQISVISSPVAGLIVYDTDVNTVKCYNGTSWISL
ncbi:MAG: hypothetical protein ACOYWZ_11075 [Bacillota bacterium]